MEVRSAIKIGCFIEMMDLLMNVSVDIRNGIEMENVIGMMVPLMKMQMERHRDDGPAIEYANGYKIWYRDGKRYK